MALFPKTVKERGLVFMNKLTTAREISPYSDMGMEKEKFQKFLELSGQEILSLYSVDLKWWQRIYLKFLWKLWDWEKRHSSLDPYTLWESMRKGGF